MSDSLLLTDLPAEILLEIMCQLPDASHLLNIVRTCSSLHNVYKSNREEILARMLNLLVNIQNGVALEADACLHAIRVDPAIVYRYIEQPFDLNKFLDEYRTRRAEQLAGDQTFQDRKRILFYPETDKFVCHSKEVGPAPLGKWPIRDFDYLVRLYKQHVMIQSCVYYFCETTLAEPSESSMTKLQQDRRKKPLSFNERRRLYRAFYRFHLYNELFVRIIWPLNPLFCHAVWLCTFPPHETEEMATVYQWLDDGWRKTYEDIDHERDWDDQQQRTDYIDLGLKTFLEVRWERDESRLQSLSNNFGTEMHSGSESFGACLPACSPFRGSWECKDVVDGFPENGTKLTFQNDHPDCPNHGWLWAWKYRMSSRFYHFSHSDLRRIGHVMWDRDRLDSWEIYQGPPPKLQQGNWRCEGWPTDFPGADFQYDSP